METNLTLTAVMHADLWEKPPEICHDVSRDISKSFITASMLLQVAMGVY